MFTGCLPLLTRSPFREGIVLYLSWLVSALYLEACKCLLNEYGPGVQTAPSSNLLLGITVETQADYVPRSCKWLTDHI